MKTILKFLCVMFIFTGIISACSVKEKDDELITKSNNDEIFYYYGYEDIKIYLEQVMDKIFLKFTSDIYREQISLLIEEFSSLQLIDDALCDVGLIHFAALESKNGKPIPQETIESLKIKDEIISATYLYLYDGKFLQGIMDEFVVKCKATTSYAQLNILAEQNKCTIGSENTFVKNQFTLYVPKNSNLNAMQMANLFYETRLFEFAEPNFAILNAANQLQTY